MNKRLVLASVSVSALLGAHASGSTVNLGNLTVYNNPLTFVNFNAPAGGGFVKFQFKTDWSHNYGTPTSNAAYWYVGNPINSIIGGLTSITGMAANANPSTITVTGNFTIGVAGLTPLKFVAAQNQWASPAFVLSAYWSNTTLSFYVQKPLPPVPSGIVNMGSVQLTSGNRARIDTSGTDFSPVIGLYDFEGYLLGSNGGGTVGLPGSALDEMMLVPGTYYVAVGCEGSVLGAEDFEATPAPGGVGGTLGGDVSGVEWPDHSIDDGTIQWFSFTAAPPVCPADITNDGVTSVADFNVLAAHFGQNVPLYSDGDLTGDFLVSVADFNILAGDFGCSD